MGKKLQVQLDFHATDFRVMADPAKFQQIIWNLFKNAIKFTGENGRITISSANHLPHILTLSVGDTGIGIEPEIMKRIFNPFETGRTFVSKAVRRPRARPHHFQIARAGPRRFARCQE